MDRMLIKRIGCAILAILLLTLCGCGLIRQSRETIERSRTEMNELLVQYMTCIENNDVEGAAALSYDPNRPQDFAALRASWPACSTDAYELKDLNIDANIAGAEDSSRTVRAVYLVKTGGEDYQVILVKKHDKDGDGLVSVEAERVQDLIDQGLEPATGKEPVPNKTIGQWCFTGIWILSCLFCLFTIIDIIRKKPKLYGLWILCALVFFGGHLYRGPGGIQAGINLGLLNASQWIRYYGGASRYQLCLPIGAILYWLLRKQLLNRPKAAVYAVPVEETPPKDTEL